MQIPSPLFPTFTVLVIHFEVLFESFLSGRQNFPRGSLEDLCLCYITQICVT